MLSKFGSLKYALTLRYLSEVGSVAQWLIIRCDTDWKALDLISVFLIGELHYPMQYKTFIVIAHR